MILKSLAIFRLNLNRFQNLGIMTPDNSSLSPHLQGLLLLHKPNLAKLVDKLNNRELLFSKLLLGLFDCPSLTHQLLLLPSSPSVSLESHFGKLSFSLSNLLL